jgi:hypothetical protein
MNGLEQERLMCSGIDIGGPVRPRAHRPSWIRELAQRDLRCASAEACKNSPSQIVPLWIEVPQGRPPQGSTGNRQVAVLQLSVRSQFQCSTLAEG